MGPEHVEAKWDRMEENKKVEAVGRRRWERGCPSS